MTSKIHLDEADQIISFPNGSSIVLLDRMAKEDIYGAVECARNIFLIDMSEKIIWQIKSQFDQDGGPFTKMIQEHGNIKAYRWDGGSYTIDVKTGKASPLSLEK